MNRRDGTAAGAFMVCAWLTDRDAALSDAGRA